MAVERGKHRNRERDSVEITNLKVEREREGEQEHRKCSAKEDAAGGEKHT